MAHGAAGRGLYGVRYAGAAGGGGPALRVGGRADRSPGVSEAGAGRARMDAATRAAGSGRTSAASGGALIP